MKLRLYRYESPLRASVSLRKGETLAARRGVILSLTDGGGPPLLAEAAPLPGFSSETVEEVEEALKELRALDVEEVRGLLGGLVSEPARFPPSVDFALGTLRAASRREPAGRVPLCGLLEGDEGWMLRDAARLRRRGYGTAKVKVGRGEVGEEAKTIRRVSEAFPDGALRLDANRAWSLEEALEFARLVEGVNVEFVEEPLAAPSGLRRFSEESGLPVALDETLATLEPDDLKTPGFVRAVVLKVGVLGWSRSASFARRAEEVGARVVVSAAYESGVGTLGLLRFAAGMPDSTRLAAGLDTYRRLEGDVLRERLDLSGPEVEVGTLPAPELDTGAVVEVV